MPKRALTFALFFVLISLAAGCGDGDSNGDPTPVDGVTPTGSAVTATVTATVKATPAPDIKEQDLEGISALQEFVSSSGGEVDLPRAIYVDLTGDGSNEAVVPISSGGTLGDIAVFVVGYGSEGLQDLLRVVPDSPRSSIRASVEDGQLVTTEEVFGPDDPLCCPSQVMQRTYGWDGAAFILEDEAIMSTSEDK